MKVVIIVVFPTKKKESFFYDLKIYLTSLLTVTIQAIMIIYLNVRKIRRTYRIMYCGILYKMI
jgi:hypothetical protein